MHIRRLVPHCTESVSLIDESTEWCTDWETVCMCVCMYTDMHTVSQCIHVSVYSSPSLSTHSLYLYTIHTLSQAMHRYVYPRSVPTESLSLCISQSMPTDMHTVYAYRHAHSLCLQTCTQSMPTDMHTVSRAHSLYVYPSLSLSTHSVYRDLQRESFKERASKRQLQRESFKERASKRELQRESFKERASKSMRSLSWYHFVDQQRCAPYKTVSTESCKVHINKDVHLTRLFVERAWKPIARVSATSLAETDGTGSRGGSASTSCFNLMLQLNVYPHSVCHIAHSLYVSTSLHSSQGILVDMTHEQRGAPYMTLPSIQTYTFNHSCLVAQSP